MKILLIGLFQLIAIMSVAQNVKFGKVTAADLEMKVYEIDPEAEAVIISDVGSANLVGLDDWFGYSYTKQVRIHILNKKGYEHATVEIPLYVGKESKSKVQSVKGVTYNLEGSKVVESKMDKNALVKETVDKNQVVYKFTLPNVKEGSIIEYEYKVIRDYIFEITPWYFQSTVPVLWSEYKIALPSFLKYMSVGQLHDKFHIQDSKEKKVSYNVIQKRDFPLQDEHLNISGTATEFRWAMKDMPPIRNERFISSYQNHAVKLEFQLAGYDEPLTKKNFISTWPEVTKELLENNYTKSLKEAENTINDIAEPFKKYSNEKERAKKIFEYVRDQYTCIDDYDIYTEQPLKNLAKNKKGTVADINLFLVALLRSASIPAEPVILSKRERGLAPASYPLISRFNYMICQATIGSQVYYLDASQPKIGFGKLSSSMYNGEARVVNTTANPVYFKTTDLVEKESTNVSLAFEDGKWNGGVIKKLGYFDSYELREDIATTSQEKYLEQVQNEYSSNIKVSDLLFDSLDVLEQSVTMKYKLTMEKEDESILYVNPMLAGRWLENPFKAANRTYPVEMPYKIDESYTLTMQVPEGYIVDELPKSLTVKLNPQNDASFEYRINSSENMISLVCALRFNRTDFTPSDYHSLREFFSLVVNKQNEQIVLKKKS